MFHFSLPFSRSPMRVLKFFMHIITVSVYRIFLSMRAVIQRVTKAAVNVDGETVSTW